MTDLELQHELSNRIAAWKSAKARGDAKAMVANQASIDATVKEFVARGYEAEQVLEVCGG